MIFYSKHQLFYFVRARHTYFIWQASMMQASCGANTDIKSCLYFPPYRYVRTTMWMTTYSRYYLRMTNRLATL